jgi:multidrug efflux pump subunit AcrA (membrane-fusion protein)
MKKLVLALLLLLAGAAAGGSIVWVLGGTPRLSFLASEPATQNDTDNGTVVKYVGPMHPQIVRDQPGKCPICGMDLVKKVIEGGKAGQSGSRKRARGSGDSEDREVLYWVAPMDPSYKRDKPGKSPMGMDLVPVYAEDVAAKPGTITIDPVVVHNLGVETTKVKRATLSRTFRTIGEVTYDERSVSHIHTRVNGWVERLYLDAPGDRVQRGAPILRIYSPELVTTQEEFLLALRRKKRFQGSRAGPVGDLQEMVRQARERLRFFGISNREIDKIAETGEYQPTILLRAPHSGVVTELGVREGMRVTPQKNLYTIADLSTVWVIAHIYAGQADWVEPGNKVVLSLPFHPGRQWQGRVDYVYPFMEPMTRTVKSRLVFENKNGLLKPNMFATATIQADPKKDVLTVPEEAVIRTGRRSVVVTALGEGRFRPVEVTTGIEANGRVEIQKGLAENQLVVTNSQFLIDAESDLQAGLQRMEAEEKPMDMESHNASRHMEHSGSGTPSTPDHSEHQGHGAHQ